jgi:LTXXQ motif family protein
MRKIGACFAIAALAATTLSPTPGAAFGLNLGPLHLGLPFFGLRHRRHVPRRRLALHHPARGASIYDRANVNAPAPATSAEPAALHPAATLPGLLDAVFWPGEAAQWPFNYDALFRSAFVKTKQGDATPVCQQPDRTAALVGRIGAEVRPTAAQQPLLQKLGQALGMASGYMARACARALPPQPVARLKLIQSQLQLLTMAIDVVRPPLQQFEQSLDANQKKQFAALNSNNSKPECGAAPIPTAWAVDEINHSVQPDDAQRQALDGLKLTFASIANDLHAHCPNPVPGTPLARLEAMEARLDASWRAALAMQVALGQFESQLNGQQRTRLEAMNLPQAY